MILNNKLITIVTVVYNAENLVEETIQSVINQTFFEEVEYIIIDGKSKDKTIEIINKYKDKIDILVSEPDNGIYDAMNKAISLANGEWINFMNAGDTFVSNDTLEKVFKNKVFSEFDFVYGNNYYVGDKFKTLQITRPLSSFWKGMPFNHQSVFSKTTLMKECNFNLKYKIQCEFEFLYKNYVNGKKFKKVDVIVANYLADGFSDRYFIDRTLERLDIILKYENKNNQEIYREYFKKIDDYLEKEKNKIKLVESDKFCISVVIPNYNNAKYLEDCLESIITQTHKNIEIVVVDDCSTDNSRDILNKYSEKYSFIKLIFNEVNQGVGRNRDIGIRASIGDFITTLDSDDIFLDKDKLKKELELILKYQQQGEDIIAFSNIVLVDKNLKKLKEQSSSSIKEGNIYKYMITRDCMIPRDFLFSKKQYLKTGGFDPNIPIYEDWDLKIRLSKLFKFYYTRIDGIGYRRHGSGLSAVDFNEHKKWLNYVFNKNISQSGLNRLQRKMIRTWFNRLFLKRKVRNLLKGKIK